MDLSNFNQDLANQFVGAYAEGVGFAAQQLFRELKADAGLPPGLVCVAGNCGCAENCECDSISYNNTVGVAKVLGGLLDSIKQAGIHEAYGSLIPRFLCIAEKALQYKPEASNGNPDSEPIAEQSPKKKSGR